VLLAAAVVALPLVLFGELSVVLTTQATANKTAERLPSFSRDSLGVWRRRFRIDK
jgi:hypothetical protein